MWNNFPRIVLFLLIIVFLPSCHASEEIIYRGTAYVTAEYDSGTKNYQQNVEVILDSPTVCESFQESNPFGFTISGGGSSSLPKEGEFFLDSCMSYSDPTLFEGCVLLQYWTFTYSDNTIQGELTDNHIAEAAAMNNFYGQNEFISNLMGEETGWPLPMAQGSSIYGQIDDQTANLKIEGLTQDQSAHFVIQIEAARV
jgi:hypothetical protein